MTLNRLDLFGDAYNSSGFNNVFYSTNEATEPKTIDFPDTYTFDNDIGFKAVFVNGDVSSDADTHMTLNGKPVKISHNGTLIDLPVHTLTEGSTTVYRSLQPNIILDLFYNVENDAFIVVGNPTVICNDDNLILADGTVIWDFVKDKLDENYGLTPEHYNGTAKYAEAIKTTGNSTDSYHKVPFLNRTGEASDSENTDILEDTEDTFAYNPSTNDLKVQSVTGNLNGVATSAMAIRYVPVTTLSGNENKSVTVPGFELSSHARLILKFVYGNSRAAELTLNVNGTGDKTIYLNGAISSPTNYIIDTGSDYIAEYDGDNWRLDSIYQTYSARNAGYADTAGNANKFAGLSYADAKTNILSGNAASATEASHAASADNATNAGYATNAGHASTADSATNATNASYATNATNATSAESASSAGSAGYANKLNIVNAGQATFNWSGQDGQPSWLFGSNNGIDVNVYNPANFRVNYASSAGSATTAGSCSGNAASATTAGSCSGNAATASDASKFDGKTYAEAKADILTGKAASAGSADTAAACTGNAATSSSCTGNAATASDASKFDGKTYAEAKANILEGKAATAGVADSAGDSTKLAGHGVISTTTTAESSDYWSYVRKSKFDANGGYIVYSNGLTIQWGIGPTDEVTIPFYVPFTSTSYCTNLGFFSDGVARQQVTKYTDKMTTGSELRRSGTNDWIAIGYS